MNPRKLAPFIEAFQQRIKLEREQQNFMSWLSGMYVTHAIAACFGKNHAYPSQPVSLDSEDTEEKNKKDAQRFEAYAISFNQQFRKQKQDQA